jgi:hypothetical protein
MNAELPRGKQRTPGYITSHRHSAVVARGHAIITRDMVHLLKAHSQGSQPSKYLRAQRAALITTNQAFG